MGIALNPVGEDISFFLGIFANALGEGLQLAIALTGADEKVVGKNCLLPQIK